MDAADRMLTDEVNLRYPDIHVHIQWKKKTYKRQSSSFSKHLFSPYKQLKSVGDLLDSIIRKKHMTLIRIEADGRGAELDIHRCNLLQVLTFHSRRHSG